MTEAWRNHYDRWKLAGPPEPEYDDDGEPIDPDEMEAQREAAEEARAERQREDMMLYRDSLEDWWKGRAPTMTVPVTIDRDEPDGSAYDAIYLAVAEATGADFRDVRRALVHRAVPDDAFWAAWDDAVREATDLYALVREEQ